MSDYERAFRASADFARRRSGARTAVYAAVTAIAAIGLLLTVLNLDAYAAMVRDAGEQSARWQSRLAGQLGAGPLVLLCLGALAVGVIGLLRGSWTWVRVETGHRLRRRWIGGFTGDDARMHEHRDRFISGDPRMYTPSVPVSRRWDYSVEVWEVPEDELAYVGFTRGGGPHAEALAELRFRNAPYRALLAAVRNGLDKPLPDERNPMVDGAAAVPDARPFDDLPVARTEGAVPVATVTVPVDRARVQAALGMNRTLTIVGVLAAVLAVTIAVLVLVAGIALLTLLIAVAVLLLVVAVLYLPKLATLRRGLRTALSGDGTAVEVSARGIRLGWTPLLPWSELLGVIIVDDTARTARVNRLPLLIGRGGALALRAGDGVLGLVLAVRDGEALRADPATTAPRAVRLWTGSPRPADITVLLDALLSPSDAGRVLTAVEEGARLAGVPVQRPAGGLAFATALGDLVDPRG